MTAKAAIDAVNDLTCVRRVYYVDYASSQLPENLNPRERDMESSVFAVTLAGVLACDHRTSWHHYDKSFVGRNYFRVEEGSGRCGSRRPAPRRAGRIRRCEFSQFFSGPVDLAQRPGMAAGQYVALAMLRNCAAESDVAKVTPSKCRSLRRHGSFRSMRCAASTSSGYSAPTAPFGRSRRCRAQGRCARRRIGEFLSYQMNHAPWEGFRFYDLFSRCSSSSPAWRSCCRCRGSSSERARRGRTSGCCAARCSCTAWPDLLRWHQPSLERHPLSRCAAAHRAFAICSPRCCS